MSNSNDLLNTRMNFIKTTRGKPMLVYDFYLYTQDRTIQAETNWRCRIRGCTAIVLLDLHNTMQAIYIHICNESEDKRKAIIARYKIKERIQSTNEPILGTITEITRTLSTQIVANLPSYESIRTNATQTNNMNSLFLLNDQDDIPPVL